MTRRPIFWLIFSALGVAGAVTAVTLFSTALPNISVDITMDRSAAIDSAADLAGRSGWGAMDDRSAATFGLADGLVQTYIELEGGGSAVIERLAERNVYEAYQWRVRRFAEGRVEESLIRFTPAGEPYGFRLRLGEDDPGGGNRPAGEARAVAAAAAEAWRVDLGPYRLLESASETLPSGRIDHTFVYERTDERLGDAAFRLRVVVAGDVPSELTHFVSVPEAFSRRYADMRSTNDSIALGAQAILLLVFVLFGAGLGSALLLRQRWLEWRAPLAWGGVIAFLFGAATVNRLPLSWTAYDTALSSTSFAVQQLAGGAAIALLGTPLIAFFLLAGESLGRRAFPQHVQQWRFWSPEVASSNTALGMTAAAYLMVGLQVGYVVLFYLGTQRLEGWWSPADALVQPDLLATYLPWLEAVSLSLFASFWEESLFRAVPIACAALLGARFGKRGVWIWGAVVVQAVVFAAGHANYPQQPPYARVVELTVPALMWGIVYVGYGLVPTILAHFIYDLSLISTVLFASRAIVDQAVILAIGLIPLGVILVARRRLGVRSSPPGWAYNGAWAPAKSPPERAAGRQALPSPEAPSKLAPSPGRPPDAVADAADAAAPYQGAVAGRGGGRVGPLPRWSGAAALATGVAAVLAWAALSSPPIRLWGDRDAAVQAAAVELGSRGVRIDDWDVFVTTSSGATAGREYVFQVAEPEEFSMLEGEAFGVPSWFVRLVDWDAESAARVEEYQVWVGLDGEVNRVRHVLPEATPGASLEVDEARGVALEELRRGYTQAGEALREVEAQETSRPSRTDWLFTFDRPDVLAGVEGEARLQVRIAGDEVVDVAHTVDIPEEWQRNRRRTQNRAQVMGGGLGVLLLVMFGAAAVTAVVVWSRHGLPGRVVARLSLVGFVALIAWSANGWPLTSASFATSQPWSFQASATLIALLVAACVASPAIGLVGALGHAWLSERPTPSLGLRTAIAYGVLFGGLSLLGGALVPSPATGAYGGAATAVPLLGPAIDVIPAFLLLATGLLGVVAFRWRFHDRPFVAAMSWSLVLAAAVVLVPTELQASAVPWALATGLVGAVLAVGLHVCVAEPALVPGLVATILAVRGLGESLPGPYVSARAGALIAAIVLGAMAWVWTRALSAPRPPRETDQSLGETRASVGSE